MGIIDTVKTIKKIQVQDVVMIKIGKFVYGYGKDASILSYLFGYKIKKAEIEPTWIECGFPICSINKVMAKLEETKINYILIDRRNNYDVDEKADFRNLNMYEQIYEKASKYVKYKKRIDNITNYLTKNIEKINFINILNKLEEDIANEGRKI